MSDFNVRSDSVNVEQIMDQIRARIREKRGVDYTEQQIRDLADVKLETFLDPRGVRSDLLDQFRKAQPAYTPPELPNFAFEDATLFESHRAPIRWIRRLLMPLLKLLFNPNPLIQALHIQSSLNTMNADREARRESARRAMDQLYYELIHNLVVETTRLGIEVKNLKMRVESVSSRLEFNERRARALESAVVYKPSLEEPAPQRPAPPPVPQQRSTPPPQSRPYTPPPPATVQAAPPPIAAAASGPQQAAQGPPPQPGAGQIAAGEGPGQRSRRRRRRRGRRGGGAASTVMGAPESTPDGAVTESTEQMDAMDRMDDDGSPESEEAHAVAADTVEQALTAQAERSETVDEGLAAPPAPVDAPAPAVASPQSDPAASADSHPAFPADSHPVSSADASASPSAGSGPGGSDPDSQ